MRALDRWWHLKDSISVFRYILWLCAQTVILDDDMGRRR